MKAVKGVSLIEIILVVAIIAILAATVSPFLSSYFLRNNASNTVDKVVATIRKAQEYTMTGRHDLDWGVCIDGQTLKLYGGTSCSSNTIEENFNIPSSVSISGISDTKFTNRGEPNPSNGLSSISITADTGSVTVQVNSAGGMEIN